MAPNLRNAIVLCGALWLTSALQSAQVVDAKKIAPPGLAADDGFGRSVVPVGDVNGDGIGDWVAGAHRDDDGGADRGAVYVLVLDANACLTSHVKISSTQGGFVGQLHDFDHFGTGVAALGDIDGDGVPDVAVGEPNDADGGPSRGAVWILFLNADGTVKSEQKISSTSGGFGGVLADGDQFGGSVAALGDLDGNGSNVLAVGANGNDDGGADTGAVWVLFLNSAGTVDSEQKISRSSGGFGGALSAGDEMGYSIAAVGDVNGDGVVDLAAGAPFDDDGGADRGAVWLLFLTSSGTVLSECKISGGAGSLPCALSDGDRFGESVGSAGDLNNDGRLDLVVGAAHCGPNSAGRGAAWEVYLDVVDGSGLCRVLGCTKLGDGTPHVVLQDGDAFGQAATGLGDLFGDKRVDLLISSVNDNGGRGALWWLDRGVEATALQRNGMGCNPVTFTSGAGPVVGTSWDATVALGPPHFLSAILVGEGGPFGGLKLNGALYGELLCLPPYPPADIGSGNHSLEVPCDALLIGREFCLQGVMYAPGDIALTNAIDVTVGTY